MSEDRNTLIAVAVVERDWNAELAAIYPHPAEWVEPREPDPEDDGDAGRSWAIRLLHESGHETLILCFEDAEECSFDLDEDFDDSDAHRSRSMYPRLAQLVEDRT